MNSLSNIHLSKRELVILNATLELVAAEGLLKTSISKISKRAKSSPGIVYHYFASKDEIMDTLFISIVTEMMAFILNNVNADGDGLVLDRYKKLWMRKYQYHLENPEKTVFIEQFKNSSYYTAERELENQQLMGGLLLIGNADIEKGLLVNLPLDIIYTMTFSVALNLAKSHIHTQISLDDQVLETIAERVCKSVIV